MTTPTKTRVTQILASAAGDDPHTAEELLPLVYGELRRLARAYMARESGAQTLVPTALVHEAYARLVGCEDLQWENRAHFFSAAARAMRRILVDRARRRRTPKHGGDYYRVTLDRVQLADKGSEDSPDLVLALDEALQKLEQADPRKARIVMLRYFAGMTIEETACALHLSPGTIKNEWRFSRAWLLREMTRDDMEPA